MIKICHVTSTPQSHIPRLLRETSSALKMQMKPYVIAQGDTYEKDGVSFVGVKRAKNRLYRMIITSRKLYKEAIKIDADIYQIHDPELLLYALRLKKKEKVVIFDSHEFYGVQIETKEYIPKLIRNLIARVYMVFETYICKKIDAVIAVCTINDTDYFANRSKKTVLVANMPDSNIFSKDISKIEKDIKTAVYVGALNHSRGITHLVRSLALTPAQLILCGSFSSSEYYEELRQTPEFSKVEYRGVVSRKEIVDILSKSSIGVSTLLHVGQYSKIDTLPTKVYEYMSMGLPVIISDSNFAKKVINEYEFGICVNPENINEIANKINYLIENPEVARRMGENGVRAIQEKYNWNFEEMKLIKLYEEVIYKKIQEQEQIYLYGTNRAISK